MATNTMLTASAEANINERFIEMVLTRQCMKERGETYAFLVVDMCCDGEIHIIAERTNKGANEKLVLHTIEFVEFGTPWNESRTWVEWDTNYRWD